MVAVLVLDVEDVDVERSELRAVERAWGRKRSTSGAQRRAIR